MRIGIDARLYGPKKQKGLGRYVEKLIEELEKTVIASSSEARAKQSRPPAERAGGKSDKIAASPTAPRNDNEECEFIIFLRQQNWNEYQPKNGRFKKVLADYKWYGLSEQIFFPFKIWQNKIDLMHFPHFNAVVFCPTKFVMTIHDLILKKFPSQRASTLAPLLYKIKYLGYSLIIWLAVKRAKKIITVSEFTKKDILKHFDVSENKIEVIYNGISVATGVSCNDTLKKYNIAKPYLLYVGNAYPHKNLEKLILAFDKIADKYPDLKLVMVGELDYFYKKIKNYVSSFRFQVSRNIVFTNFVSDEELAELYKNACLYVFPSLYEGFGLPPLEAMSYNLPVVCSDASCLPEILGNAALYFNPENIDDMIDKILQAINNSEIKEKLVLQGQQRIKQYSWQRMAEETVKKVYK